MKEKIIFFNTGWMDFYQGLKGDSIYGGGKNVKKIGWGTEIFNFKFFEIIFMVSFNLRLIKNIKNQA